MNMSESVKQEMQKAHTWTDGGDRVLILRRIAKDGTSHGGFSEWGKPDELNITIRPKEFVDAPTCGGGLHGWAWGMGLGEGCDYSLCDDRWLVVSAKPDDVVGEVDGGDKVKCREVVKIFDGTFAGAWAMINGGRHRLIAAMAASCVDATAASGDYSKLAASGHSSKLAASGDYSNLAASGHYSKLAASGHYSKLAASGDSSNLAASGDYSNLAASGHYSKLAASGHYSKLAASGDYSNLAASGKSSIAAAIGTNGIVAAGELGCIVSTYWDSENSRYRVVVGYVGQDGIEAGVSYRLNSDHKFEPMK